MLTFLLTNRTFILTREDIEAIREIKDYFSTEELAKSLFVTQDSLEALIASLDG